MKAELFQNVLVVEDNPYMQEIIAKMMSRYSRSVKKFSKGSDCIEAITKEPVDLVILDHYLEDDLNGIDVLKKIRSINPNTNVVFLSGQENLETALDSLKYGAIDYIEKDKESASKLNGTLVKLLSIKKRTTERRHTRSVMLFIAAVVLGVIAVEVLISLFNPNLFDM